MTAIEKFAAIAENGLWVLDSRRMYRCACCLALKWVNDGVQFHKEGCSVALATKKYHEGRVTTDLQVSVLFKLMQGQMDDNEDAREDERNSLPETRDWVETRSYMLPDDGRREWADHLNANNGIREIV